MSRSSLRIAFGLVLAVVLAWGMSLDTRAAATAAANATATAVNGGAGPAGTPAGEPEPIPSRSLAGVFMTDAVAADAAQAQGGQRKAKGQVTRDQLYPEKFQKVAPSEQKAAAQRARKLGMLPGIAGANLASTTTSTTAAAGDFAIAAAMGPLPGIEGPGGVPHYFGPYGNWAFSPLPSGSIATVRVVEPGAGYASAPTVTVVDAYVTSCATDPAPPCYTPAVVTATIGAVGSAQEGTVTGFSITDGGSGYMAPVVVVEGGGGADALADAIVGGTLSGGIRKFVDSLPGLGPAAANNLGQYIPVAIPEARTFSGQAADYYEIALVQYTQKLHSDLDPTTLRGYVQVETPGVLAAIAASRADADPSNDLPLSVSFPLPGGKLGVTEPRYLGPVIVAKGRVHSIQVAGPDRGDPVPARIKFYNLLPTDLGGDLFIPVDETVPGSGYGPAGPGGANDKYKQNRAAVHLHGNNTVWISDGNTHQWITPAGETTPYPKGVSVRNVPDMLDAGGNVDCDAADSGCMTFFYTNAQSARLQFYHDHAHGITRLNVYAGEAGGYLVTDQVEQDLINGTNFTGVNINCTDSGGNGTVGDQAGECAKVLPGLGTPLVIQDKTFVDPNTVFAQDPTWAWGPGPIDPATGYPTPQQGDLWYPHVYMTVQNPWDLTGTNGFGRWHYGPWFNPPTPECINGGPVGCIETGPVPNEYYQPDCDLTPPGPGCAAPWEPPMRPGVPNPSIPGESFMDTPLVNGTAYPYLVVEAKPQRFRILNAANDRFWNLQLYEAFDGANFHFGTGADDPSTAVGVLDVNGAFVAPCTTATTDLANPCTEVKMIPVGGAPNQLADTASGIPDPLFKGPDWWLIGTEGGFMPKPTVIPQQPSGWNLDMAYFAFGVINQHSLWLGSAERADVIVDFSGKAGKTYIVYNDSPAPVPAGAAPYDNYTGDGNLMDAGGAPNTLPGYGPNTRTVMQIRVVPATTPTPDVTLANLQAVWAKTGTKRGVFEASQDTIVVPQAAYGSAYNNPNFPTNSSQYILNVQDTQKTFRPLDANGVLAANSVTIPLEMKAMHDEMGGVYDTMFGRMSGMLGLTNPNSPVHVLIPYGFSAPPTDVVRGTLETTKIGELADGTQIWRIFHNGVDTHPIHTHLFHAQLINRVDQSGQVTGGTLPVDPMDLGWKDTIKINPLEITFLALRPTVPTPDQLPFEVEDSIRLIDPGLPEGASLIPPAPAGWFDPLGLPLGDLKNHYVNFGWEYVWHCHILSHEEMDFMHSLAFAVPPKAAEITEAPVTGNQNNRTVTLTWIDNSIKEIGYRVERATDPGFTTGLTVFPSATTLLPANTTTYANTRVPNNRAYWYRVIAVGATVGDTSPGMQNFPTMSADSASNSWPVVVGTATTAVPADPGPGLTAIAAAGPQVNLTWTDNATNETGFVVERCTGVGCTNFAQIATVGPLTGTGSVNYADTTVATNNTYSYRVWAVNAVGRSANPTNVATVTVAALPVAPINATLTVARSGGGQTPYSATLTWFWPDAGNGSNPSSFTVQRATNLAFTTGLNTQTVAAGLRTITQTRQLRANTVYYFRIRANNTAGSSAWTNVLPFPIRTGQ